MTSPAKASPPPCSWPISRPTSAASSPSPATNPSSSSSPSIASSYQNTTDSAYATVFFADYDDTTRRLRYANCGHLSAILLRHNGQVECLHSTATVLGLFEEWNSPTVECQLSPGDIFALYTDGVTESFNESEEEFGEDRLIDRAPDETHSPRPRTFSPPPSNEIQRFSPHEQHDDITLIVAKCTANTLREARHLN